MHEWLHRPRKHVQPARLFEDNVHSVKLQADSITKTPVRCVLPLLVLALPLQVCGSHMIGVFTPAERVVCSIAQSPSVAKLGVAVGVGVGTEFEV